MVPLDPHKIVRAAESNRGSLHYAMKFSPPELVRQFRELLDVNLSGHREVVLAKNELELLHARHLLDFVNRGLGRDPRLAMLMQGFEQEEIGRQAILLAEQMSIKPADQHSWLSILSAAQSLTMATYFFYLSKAVLLNVKDQDHLFESGAANKSLQLFTAVLIFLHQAGHGIVSEKN